MTATIGNAVEWWAWDAPERMALAFGDDKVTYPELHHWADRVAQRLVDEGVKVGDRVGIFAGNSLDWCAAAIGVIRTGAILVPLNYRYTTSELSSVVENCAPAILITDGAREDRVQALKGGAHKLLPVSMIADLRKGPEVKFARELDPAWPTVIAYTSGSTAQPKGVVLTHETMLAYAFESSLVDSGWGPGMKGLGVAPLYTGAGIITLVQFLVLGMSAWLTDNFDPAESLRTLMEEKIDNFVGVPTFFERIAQVPAFKDADLSHIRFSSCGGARVPKQLLADWLEHGVVVRQLYGLTEGGGGTTVMDIEGAKLHPEKCGPGGPFTKHKVVDENFRTVPPNTPGEILLRGPTMMTGYWNNPKATAETFVDGWLRTGDIGTQDEDGNITVVDRLKELIISGGLNISPIDVESVIMQIDGVLEVAVFSALDEKFGETPIAILHASRPLAVADIIAHCNAHLANYKVPRYVVIEPEPLPRLATGKISKRDLKAKYKDAEKQLEKVR